MPLSNLKTNHKATTSKSRKETHKTQVKDKTEQRTTFDQH
jgi:hypothetical protein